MIAPQSTLEGTAQPVPAKPARYGLKYYVRRTVIYALSSYLLLCLLLFLFQRKLLYPASRMQDGLPERHGLPVRQARLISALTGDGITLGGWHLLPLERAGTDFDAALREPGLVSLFFHGNGGHRGHRTGLYETLNRLGCHVVCFDYRGYGESAGEPSEEGLAADARAAWEWATHLHGVAPERVVLHGESLGSAVVVRLAQELCIAGTPPAGVVLETPFSSLVETAAHLYWFVPVRLILRERFPSRERIGQVTCPLIVFHGHRDVVVPFEQGRRLWEAAPPQSASGRSKRLVEFVGSGHNDLRDSDAALYERELREFLGGLAN